MIKPENPKNLPKVGLVLSGGGIKPYGSVYILEMLEEMNIPLSVLGAVSGGSHVAGLYSIGYPCDEIKKILTDEFESRAWTVTNYQFFFRLFNYKSLPFSAHQGLFKKADTHNTLKRHFVDSRLENTQIPLVIAATNFENGKTEFFTKGSMADVIYASSAIIPLFPPISLNGKYYIDGGYSLGDPFTELVKMDLDLIIVVSFFDTTHDTEIGNFSTMNNFIMKSFHLCFNSTQRLMTILTHDVDTIFIPVQFSRTVDVWNRDLLSLVYETNKEEISKFREQIRTTYEKIKKRKSGITSDGDK